MKKNILVFFCATLFTAINLQAQNSSSSQKMSEATETVIITIEGMACQAGCADAISSNLKKVSGVHSALVSFTSGQADINYNPKEISLDSLKSIITGTKVKDYVYSIKDVILVEGD